MTAAGYDGSVKIDTTVDDKGFNAGMKKLSSSAAGALNAILAPLSKIATSVKSTFEKVGSAIGTIFQFLKKLLVGVLLVAALSLNKILQSLQQSFADVLKLQGAENTAKQIKELKNKWTEVGAAVALAFLPLINAAIPYIKAAMDWLIRVFNIVAQITAAFLGQKQVLQVIPGSAARLARETESVKKNAQGALAAFDQINVLAQQQQQEDTSNLPTVEAQMVPITDNILSKVQAIKDLIAQWWADPIGMLKETWGKIVDWFKTNVLDPLVQWWNNTWLGNLLSKLWDNFTSTWKKIWENTKQTFENIKENVVLALTGIKEFLTGVFTGDWELILRGLKDIASGVFGAIFEFIKGTIRNLLTLFEGWKNQAIIIWNALPQPIKDAFNNALNFIKSIWAGIVDWFRNNVTAPLQNAFNTVLNGISNSFVAVFGGILNFVNNIIHGIINQINNMANTIINNVNNIIGLIGSITGLSAPTVAPIYTPPPPPSSPGTAGGGYHPPHLAMGAVIPPNAQFAAILGDQKSGMNLEAPADLIRQIVMEALRDSPQQNNVKVTFEGSLGALVRELKPHIEIENNRTGGSLLKK